VLAIHVRGRYHHGVHAVPAGDNAELIELGEVTAAELHAAARTKRAEDGVLAVIVGHSSLYVVRSADVVRSAGVPPAGLTASRAVTLSAESKEWRIPVVFDGADLPELLQRVPREEFLARMATLRLTVRYLGFRGGFGYLDGWPEQWAMPRRPTSRSRVARGTFAVGGSVAGFYPIDSPGGWNLLGRTGVDLEYALTPGDAVVFDVVDVLRESRTERIACPPLAFGEIVSSPLTTVVRERDWSLVERGIPPGGPFDDLAAAVAVSAVCGDVELLECAMVGPRVRFHRDSVVAWCTPDLQLRVDRVKHGEERAFGPIVGGLRAYLAIGTEAGEPIRASRDDDRHVIHALRGPHDTGIEDVECEVTPQLNRVGIRLRPLRPLNVTAPADLRSIGMQCGTVQLHPDGTLVAMGPDHPVTGGYLQPMTVIVSERWKLAQLVPGERVTLRLIPSRMAQPPY
jgi:allophanate hydrolase subunit 1